MRKPRPAQQPLWFSVYNHDYPPRTLDSWQPRWFAPAADRSGWDVLPRRLRFTDRAIPGDHVELINADFRATVPYNVSERRTPLVHDHRASFVLIPDGSSGSVAIRLSKLGRNFVATVAMDGSIKQKWDAVFDRVERDFGVSRGVLLAFWAFETDFGAVQGDFNTVNALVTLAHDCRRPELFRPQVFAALELYERGELDPATTRGAWAGEIGMVQMLPEDILTNGVDGNGDGHVSLKTSPPDALMSGAKMLRSLGWRQGEPWMQEVVMPERFDWSETGLGTWRRATDWQTAGVRPRSGALAAPGLDAAILLPQGRDGPAFLVYPNFNVFFEWNQSFIYVTTAAYFATRLEGAPVYRAGNPSPALGDGQMKALQQRLVARGHDVGGIDGILGAMTRDAVQKEQARLGLPADAWPTQALLDRL